MTEKHQRVANRRPGGRTEAVRQITANAVLSFIEHGNANFTYNELAKKTGINKTTLYRRWPTRIDLLGEAIKQHNQSFKLPKGDTWDKVVASLIRNIADFLSAPAEIAINAALLAHPSEESNRISIEYWKPIQNALQDVVEDAKARGEIPSELDSQVLLMTIISPILLDSLLNRSPASSQFVKHLTRIVQSLSSQKV